ncbi:hypothetical protein RRG08_057667 [Elysia crispata]|uniref:Uncharacterized protein n=1 Tax=Elysia crispata TaxID=231223 RepID=A0AAE0Z245_9GAST|nr:hypothetical protein RRG08_057667 [Elysia crispata]
MESAYHAPQLHDIKGIRHPDHDKLRLVRVNYRPDHDNLSLVRVNYRPDYDKLSLVRANYRPDHDKLSLVRVNYRRAYFNPAPRKRSLLQQATMRNPIV